MECVVQGILVKLYGLIYLLPPFCWAACADSICHVDYESALQWELIVGVELL